MTVEFSNLLPVDLPQPDDSIIARTGNVGATGVALDAAGHLAQGSHNGWGWHNHPWLNLSSHSPAQIEDPDIVISASCDDGILVQCQHGPDAFDRVITVMLQKQLGFPFPNAPDASLAIPPARDDPSAFRRHIQRADIVPMSY
jgi:hypothetical protein